MHVIKKINVAKAILKQLFSVILFFALKHYQILQIALVNYSEENHILSTIHGWLDLTYYQWVLVLRLKELKTLKNLRLWFQNLKNTAIEMEFVYWNSLRIGLRAMYIKVLWKISWKSL